MASQSITEFASPERSEWDEILKQSRTVLENEFFVDFIESVPAALMILNHHRQIVAANKRCLKLLGSEKLNKIQGFRPGEALDCEQAKKVSGCGTTKNCRYCGAVLAILSSMKTKQPSTEECLFRSWSGDCGEFQVETSSMKISDIYFTVFVLIDISAQKRKEVLDRIFLHDINNSLWGLKLAQDYKKMRGTDPVEADLVETRMVDRVIHEFQIYRQIVAAEKNELIVTPTLLEARQIYDEVRSQYESIFNINKMNLEVHLKEEDRSGLITDEGLLFMIIENLLKNAVEASSEGDKVTLSILSGPKTVHISVWNQAFIPEKAQAQMFKRSFSTKGKGRGIGTYSVKLMVERYLGGKINFESNEISGTIFDVALPKSHLAKNEPERHSA